MTPPSASPVVVRRVIVGTAGHVDHGKTTLVERLTGIRTDRLPEEQARGMTLDVGYAEWRLPDGTEVGLIDVPGHERLVRTMVAGATSMDLVLLVVAADDGPMPQTVEHVEILDLLGVRRAVVALTKTDLVDEERVRAVEAEVRALLRGTSLATAAVVPVSKASDDGIAALGAAIAAAIPPVEQARDDLRAFRMPVLRAFAVTGRGTVVTGIPESGRVVEGDAVEVLPGARACRVRGIQVHHRAASEARAGHRTALGLSDVPADSIRRGMVVAAAGALVPTPRFAGTFRTSARLERPIAHGASVRLHVGSEHMAARIHLLGGDTVGAGALTAAEWTGERPFLVAPGDRFVVRTENDSRTLGGGVVVERLSARLPRRREGLVRQILARAESLDDPAALVLASARAAGHRGVEPADVARANVLRADGLAPTVERLVASGALVRSTKGRLFDAEGWAEATRIVLACVEALHAKDPGIPFLPTSSVRAALARHEPAAVDAALESLFASGRLRRQAGGGIAAKDHAGTMPAIERERGDRLLEILRDAGGSPPEESELLALGGLSIREGKRTLLLLEARDEVLRAGTLWFGRAFVEDAVGRLRALVRSGVGSFTASDARQRLGMTRKYVIPLLEALDRKGLTKRSGDSRTLL